MANVLKCGGKGVIFVEENVQQNVELQQDEEVQQAEEMQQVEIQKKVPSPKKTTKIMGLSIVLAFILAIVVPVLSTAIILRSAAKEDRKIAAEIVAVIKKIDGKAVTLDGAKEIEAILEKYDALTDKQKKLVTNSKILEDAGAALKALKDQDSANRAAADEVIGMIKKLDPKVVSLEKESDIAAVQAKYDALTDTQKALVTNYKVLEETSATLQALKDSKIAEELIREIDSIDSKKLGTDSTQVNELVSKYEAMTETQKALVTNYSKIAEYQKIIKTNVDKQAKIERGVKLANNFTGYYGKWGDFGAHKNSYQGMIETAIRNSAKLREHFDCPNGPNYLEMTASRFTKSSGSFGIGSCSVSFSGYDKVTGYWETLYGEVVIKSDGSVYYTKSYFTGYYY